VLNNQDVLSIIEREGLECAILCIDADEIESVKLRNLWLAAQTPIKNLIDYIEELEIGD